MNDEKIIKEASEGVIEEASEGVIGKVNVSILLEKMPSIVIIATTSFFVLSFAYNLIYFFVLGIDIGLVPLTLADYILTAQIYTNSLVYIAIGILLGMMEVQNNDKNIPKVSRAKKIRQRLLLLFLVVLCFYMLYMNLYQSFIINIYHIAPLLGLVFLIPLLLPKKNKLIRIALVVFFGMALYFGDIAKRNMKDSFLSSNYYLHEGGKKYKLLRTFEQGFLITDEDYHVRFLYLDGKTLIEFNPNEELAEYLKSKTK